MSCREESAATLRRAGHRVTSAKLLVIEALRHAEDHLSATAVIEQVRRDSPHVNESTVYRTLGALRDSRLISETTFGHGEVAYEWLGERPHHHLVCNSCGAVDELSDEIVAGFAEQLSRTHGFVADLQHLAVPGVCAKCANETAGR
ncbi:MAG: Fur family transcriptional regulator [Chloroflexi bacterium]|nr:Fur family transcriptional regulator [Chloroflexota bacterium]